MGVLVSGIKIVFVISVLVMHKRSNSEAEVMQVHRSLFGSVYLAWVPRVVVGSDEVIGVVERFLIRNVACKICEEVYELRQERSDSLCLRCRNAFRAVTVQAEQADCAFLVKLAECEDGAGGRLRKFIACAWEG